MLTRGEGREADRLVKANIPVAIETETKLELNKVILIDDAVVLTGSFDFTGDGERNSENVLVFHDAALAAKYASNRTVHLKQSEPYPGR
jgi:phosphatidylserine/phosphatidylglycerophosphate/cardiolipin synthase-like enzyme